MCRADHSERSLNSAVPPIGDFGPPQCQLDGPEIEEIWVNYV